MAGSLKWFIHHHINGSLISLSHCSRMMAARQFEIEDEAVKYSKDIAERRGLEVRSTR